ncbi:MAG TPA: PHP domain-containing protein [Clostridia bacterium]|nr:PHP domain-containing protein [Clostridia bacterium]
MYKYDIHVHTMETSRCGYVKAPEFVARYKALGYDGLCVTDHLHDLYISLMDCHDDWQQCVNRFMYGYNEAKKAGDALGFDVIFGIELRFPENESDYLVYGVDEAWLRANPYVCHMDHEAFFKKFGDSVLIIHAHPYRYCDEVFYDCVHGLEIANCNPRHPSRNELALQLAREHPGLCRLCSSDAHRPGDEGRAGVLFNRRVRDSFELKAAIEARDFKLWCPPFEDIIKEGEAIR